MEQDNKVDFPTFGKPTKPTSAITLSSSRTSSSNASCPGCAYFGACMEEVAKCWLPSPPFPPVKIICLLFSPDISAITLSVVASRIMVPAGTWMTRSSPFFPWQFRFFPSSPFSAAHLCLWRKSFNVFMLSSTSKMISPPFPPSPPSGPPSGTYFSRRKLTWPLPPFPDFIIIFALSANIIFYLIIDCD